jgi:hypothetical protein
MHIKPNETTKELMTGMESTAKQSSMRDRAAVIVAPKYKASSDPNLNSICKHGV